MTDHTLYDRNGMGPGGRETQRQLDEARHLIERTIAKMAKKTSANPGEICMCCIAKNVERRLGDFSEEHVAEMIEAMIMLAVNAVAKLPRLELLPEPEGEP